MTRLVMNVGKSAGVGPGDVVGVLAGLAGLSRESVGAIQLLPEQTFVDVADDCVNLVLKKLKGIKFKGHKLAIERAG
jgi:ATP-dependent RNA helicase DeaD